MQKRPKPKKAVLITAGIVLYLAILNLISHVRGGGQSGITIGTVIVCIALLAFLFLASLFVKQIREPVPNREVSVHETNPQILDLGEWKIDFFCALTLAAVLFVTMFYFLGFAKAGIDAPYSYSGDGIFEFEETKRLLTGELRETDSVGAPFVSTYEDFPLNYLSNADRLLKRVIGLFTQDPAVVSNLFFLLIYPLCGLSGFFVFRVLKLGRTTSIFGAVVFALAPYIAARNVAHLTLAASFFVPLSILLCVWTAQGEDGYLKFGKGFFKNRKNIATILFALLVANNGTGYYPVFTCFFLSVVALYRLISEKNWRSLKQPLTVIGMIAFFFFLEIIPCVFYQMRYGGSIVQRGFAESEVYGLKIAQLFIPINTHGIQPLKNLADAYNSQAPLVNENATAYLGVCSLIGFLISLCAIFLPRKSSDKDWVWQIQLFSLLNICAILFATIGGFSTLFCMVFHMLRAFNRISIYILFISDAVLCICLQRFWMKSKTPVRKIAYWVCFILLSSICLFDQLPTWGASDGRLEVDKASYQSDGRFVSALESQLQPGDMVYQLPYHKFPEAGPVNNMGDYHLYVGHIHSQNLKWSYGGMKGRESDQWHERVAALPVEGLLQVIVPAGFRGIYIDALAYTPEELEELQTEIEAEIHVKPIASENETLLFYNLYPYLAEHPELSRQQIYSLEELQRFTRLISVGESVAFDGSNQDAHRFFLSGISGTEEHFAWTDGQEVSFIAYVDDDIQGDLAMELDFQAIFHAPQRMIVTCGEQTLYDEVQTDATIPAIISIPTACIQNKQLNLTFHFPNAISPKTAGVSDDERELALALTSLRISQACEDSN